MALCYHGEFKAIKDRHTKLDIKSGNNFQPREGTKHKLRKPC